VNYTNTTGVFSGLTPNTYSITVKNASGCISTATSITINAQPQTPATPTATVVDPTCSVATGSITVTGPLGAQYTYSIDGINFQATTTFNNVTPNSYTLTVKNSAGCSAAATIVVNTASAAPNLIITDPPGVCAPGTVDIISPSITAGSDAGLTYTYWANAAATIPLNNPNAVSVSGT